mmetsp:Transcript_71223/g.114944  ORF Transcript_71223/g.114944 Transcript_71223/m.114944 type:complete len:233 (-) Transcript_71223:226-924(-)
MSGFTSAELEEACSDAQLRVSDWRKEQSCAVQLEAQRGIQELYREQETIDDLKADIASVHDLSKAANNFRAEGAKLGEVVSQSAEAAARRAEVAIRTRDYLRGAHGNCCEEVQQDELLLKERVQAAEDQTLILEQFIAMYRSALGLHISRAAPQAVRLCFTCIDKVQPSRKFSLILSLADGEEGQGYGASDCSPQVPELEHLLLRLNEEQSFPSALPAFMCGLRRAFIASAV